MKQLILFLFLVLQSVAGSAQHHKALNDPEATLRTFYTLYLNQCDQAPPRFEAAIQKLKKRYCTARLLKELEDAELDYDPFLNAQDCTVASGKTLSIKKQDGSATYVVSYAGPDKKTVSVRVVMVKDGAGFKIDRIIAPHL